VSLLGGCEPVDVVEAFKSFKSLSSFDWCADKRGREIIKSTKRESDKLISDVISSFMQGDYKRLKKFQQDYILRRRARRAIKDAYTVLKKINIV
jgi:hypothetical protein